MGHKTSKFGLGFILGTIIGGTAALLLSPNTGKDNRDYALKTLAKLKRKLDDSDLPDNVKDIFGEISDEGNKLLARSKEEIKKKMEEVKEKYGDPQDPTTYVEIVEDALKIVQDKALATSDQVARLKRYFTEV